MLVLAGGESIVIFIQRQFFSIVFYIYAFFAGGESIILYGYSFHLFSLCVVEISRPCFVKADLTLFFIIRYKFIFSP
jgi:hypothetical protein